MAVTRDRLVQDPAARGRCVPLYRDVGEAVP